MSAKKFAVLGHPIKHSLSPKIFECFKSATSVEAFTYEILDISQEEFNFSQFENYDGLNVTSPYKAQVLEYVDKISYEAQVLGAANVLKKNSENKFDAYNTDVYGFKNSFARSFNFGASRNQKILVLGSGGAAKSVFMALTQLGFENLCFKARSPTAFANFKIPVMEFDSSQIKPDIVINATTIGMGAAPAYKDFFKIDYSNVSLAYDLIYSPKETPFMKFAQDQGVSNTKNGEEMLILQAYETFRIWFPEVQFSVEDALQAVKGLI